MVPLVGKAIKYGLLLCVLFCFFISGVAQTRFIYYQNLVFLNVKANDTDSLLFLMDTGANASAIDNLTAEILSLPFVRRDSVTGTAGTEPVDMVRVDKLAIGGASIPGLIVTKRDLGYSLVPSNHKLDGILGTDFLRHFSVVIRFADSTIELKKKTVGSKGYMQIPFEMENNIPRVKMKTANGQAVYLRYDSGASLFATRDVYINIPERLYDALYASDTSMRPYTYFTASGVGGDLKLPVVKGKSLYAGDLQIDEPRFIVQPRQGYFAADNAVGFFSNNLMEKYKVVVRDFLHKRMLVQKQTSN